MIPTSQIPTNQNGLSAPEPDVQPMLRVQDLNAWYGQAQVLFDVSFSIEEREIVGIFGHNGAGKSTLLRSIVRVHQQIQGAIQLRGDSVERLQPHDVALRGLTLAREGAPTFETMAVEEHIALGRRLARRADREAPKLEEVYEAFPLLADRRSMSAGYLSGGQRQALVLATAFATAPSCLLLDEPSTGLAPPVAERLYDTINALAEHGVAFLVTEQNPRWLAELSTRSYVLETGHIRSAGTPQAPIDTTFASKRVTSTRDESPGHPLE